MNQSADIKHFRDLLFRHMDELKRDYAVDSLGLFGSYVRGENRSGSDLDVLVTFQATPGLLRFIALEDHLSNLLGVKVDLVMRDALKPAIGLRILGEILPV